MKRFRFCMVAVVLLTMMAGISSCTGCGKGAPAAPAVEPEVAQVYHDYDGVVQDFTTGVGRIQALHRQTMFSILGVKDYEWRNSTVVLNDSITFETIDDLHVTDVNDVFYYWDEETGPWVQFINSNVKSGVQIPWPVNDVWIEDADMSNKEIKLSAEDVLKRLKEWNGVIPPALSMNLRYPVGPCECNVQWVIGDMYDVIFVDAVTGEISNWNPAFNPQKGVKGGDFGKPLGEWP